MIMAEAKQKSLQDFKLKPEEQDPREIIERADMMISQHFKEFFKECEEKEDRDMPEDPTFKWNNKGELIRRPVPPDDIECEGCGCDELLRDGQLNEIAMMRGPNLLGYWCTRCGAYNTFPIAGIEDVEP